MPRKRVLGARGPRAKVTNCRVLWRRPAEKSRRRLSLSEKSRRLSGISSGVPQANSRETAGRIRENFSRIATCFSFYDVRSVHYRLSLSAMAQAFAPLKDKCPRFLLSRSCKILKWFSGVWRFGSGTPSHKHKQWQQNQEQLCLLKWKSPHNIRCTGSRQIGKVFGTDPRRGIGFGICGIQSPHTETPRTPYRGIWGYHWDSPAVVADRGPRKSWAKFQGNPGNLGISATCVTLEQGFQRKCS